MTSDALGDHLNKIFENVNGWLKFAEAKNGALIVLNGAIIFGIARIHAIYKPLPGWLTWYFIIASMLLIFALLICLVSYIARIKSPQSISKRPSDANVPNIYFFGDLAKMTGDNILTHLKDKLALTDTPNLAQRDLAMQISINSRITSQKFAYFNTAVWLTIFALITPLLGFLLFWRMKNETV